MNAQWTGLNPVLTNSDAGISINTSSSIPEGKLHIHQFASSQNWGLNKKHIVLGMACDLTGSPEPIFLNPINTHDFSIEPSCAGSLDIFKLESTISAMSTNGPIVSYTGTKFPIVSFRQNNSYFHGGMIVGGAFTVDPIQNATTVNTDLVVNGLSTLNGGLNVNSINSSNGNPITIGSHLELLSHKNIILKHGDIIIKDASNNNQIRFYSNGNIRAREIKVDVAVIPDYVFNPEYKLMPLDKLEAYVKKNNHLPNIKSESEYKNSEGIELGELNMKLLEKVEELTLYAIQQQKEINELKKMVQLTLKK